ncbi:MAG TPA: hypothetical protein VFW75_07655, partial [Acetobacteraceae bacterium]|nr:hypothetical protein [Acetobacteraceae bacterium]
MTAISFVWNPQGGNTDFGTAGNWQPTGVPGPADSANFTTAAASGTITGNGTVGGLQFGATTPWVLNGADLVYNGNVRVGAPDGNLTLTNGATLDGRSTQADHIGSAAGTLAAATVTGLDTTWKTLGSVIVDGGLAVSNQATMSAAAAITVGDSLQTNGALSVQSGANLSTAGLLLVGDDAGSSGAIQLLSGGTLGVTGTGSGMELGVAAGAAGAITVSGTDSTLNTFGNQIAVGLSGAGALAIGNAGTVSTAGGPPGSGGGIALGTGNGGMGSAAVTGPGSELINVGQFTVGGNGTAQPGGMGSLLIEAGG